MMGKKKTAMKRGGAVKKRGGGMMGPKKKMAKGGRAGSRVAKLISKTKLPLHKLDAMGMLGAGVGKTMGSVAGKGLKGLAGKMAGAAKKVIKRKKKKQGYIDRKDESIAMRIRKKRTPAQLKASRDESYGKFGRGTGKGVINKRGGGVARRGMGKAK
jgi:hypothetical protein